MKHASEAVNVQGDINLQEVNFVTRGSVQVCIDWIFIRVNIFLLC
jgi:hypothetical protein